MIVYMDSSTIVKFYREEAGTQTVQEMRDEAETVLVTSMISFVEVRAALARGLRENRFVDDREYRRAVQGFRDDWGRSFIHIAITDALVELAGDLAETRALRGYDSVHLASALVVRRRINEAVRFSTWDSALSLAAKSEGLTLAH